MTCELVFPSCQINLFITCIFLYYINYFIDPQWSLSHAFCSSQFCFDIRSLLEDDFVKSLQSEVIQFVWLSSAASNLSFFRQKISQIYHFKLFFLFIMLSSLVKMRPKLLDPCLGTLRTLPGILIFHVISWGKIRPLRGEPLTIQFWFLF